MMFAMSDELIATLVSAFITASMSAFVAYLGYLTQKLNRKVESVAQTGDLTHKLVNSAMLAEKRESAVTKRALADTDPTNKVYAASAQIAEDTYRQMLNEQKGSVAQMQNANEARRDAAFTKPELAPTVTVIKNPDTGG